MYPNDSASERKTTPRGQFIEGLVVGVGGWGDRDLVGGEGLTSSQPEAKGGCRIGQGEGNKWHIRH